MTDRPDPLLARPNPTETVRLGQPRDPLSDVLRTVRLKGAVFFMLELSSPWTVAMPDGEALAPRLVPGAQQLISYHVFTRGTCWAGLLDEPPVRFEPGDVVVFPRGDGYRMSIPHLAPPQLDPARSLTFMTGVMTGRLPFLIHDGGGGDERASAICGFTSRARRAARTIAWAG
jgi:hypothetical protein